MLPARARRLVLLGGVGVWLVALMTFGLPRALERHFHVDEIQIAYEAALLGVHDLPAFANGTAPSLIVLGWLIGSLDQTATMLGVLRLAYFAMFVLNLVAIAWAQPYFRTSLGRAAVLAAVTLFHPLWLNGFEIRMDVLVVGGSILLFGLTQRAVEAAAPTRWLFFVGGMASAWMQVNSFKSFVYWVPFGAVLVGIGVWRARRAREAWHPSALFFLAGFVSMFALSFGLVAASGHTDVMLRGVAAFSSNVERANRFTPTPELVRLALDSPVVFGLAAVSVALVAYRAAKKHASACDAITIIYLFWVFFTLYVNPTPYPYNFIHVLPFVAIAAIGATSKLAQRPQGVDPRWAVGVALAAAIVFVRAWTRDPFLTRTNAAQLSYIAAAEALTTADDTILDGAGLVLTRRPPHEHWLVHSLRMTRYKDGELTRFADIMRTRPSPVVLDNYRWSWLSPDDLRTRDERYVRLAPRLLVLGQRLSPTSGSLDVHYAGRYRLATANDDAVRLDGAPLPAGGIVTLTVGPHRYEGIDARGGLVHWVGPDEEAASAALLRISTLGPGEPFFTNEPRSLAR